MTEHAGGDGAGRDAIEFIPKAQGTWKRVVSEYIWRTRVRKRALGRTLEDSSHARLQSSVSSYG